MTTVRFEPEGVEVEVAAGTRLVDVTDEHPEADVPFSCRSASCGTCRVHVRQGMAALNEADEVELEVLEIFDSEPGVRLCCQLVLERDADRVVLEVVDPM